MSSVLCYDIHICDLVFLVTLSKRMTKRQYVIKTKTIVSVLTFLRSSQGIVGWGGGGRQMDGGTDKWDRGQVFLIASLLFVLGFLMQLCVDFFDLFVFVFLIASLFFVPGFLIQLRLDFFDIVQSICICASNCLPLVCAWISYQTLFEYLWYCTSYFLSDPSPIIGYAYRSLTDSLTDSVTLSKLYWCDPGVWRCQLKTCWGCYCCWCW